MSTLGHYQHSEELSETDPWRPGRSCGPHCDLYEPVVCGIDMEPSEPGHYVCDSTSSLPHHECGQHHDPARITCDNAAELMAADEQLLSYAL